MATFTYFVTMWKPMKYIFPSVPYIGVIPFTAFSTLGSARVINASDRTGTSRFRSGMACKYAWTGASP